MSQDLEATKQWVRDFHTAGDSLDVNTWAKWLTDDATIVMGNNPPVQGRDNFTKAYSHQAGLLSSMYHELISVDVIENRVYDRAILTYEIKGDDSKEKIKIPSMVVLHRTEDKKISKLEVFSDPSPLMERVKAIMAAKAQAAA
ncbi:NTF2-like protein [Stereum hirsutum FP-91666 SS1]|uniref:NTF2-like protein n=1 Tax=Stereum hirsutum (strain FP-91666) TaxID=721885 RepID=UPI000440E57C|nr:NTF2-like protein [Stereum hirsutum FP-91666 SS1]EIM89927.1 NTF2-like protein [Stereum hirsutum FP-91666 SS1]